MAKVTVTGAGKSYGTVPVFSDLSLEIADGEFLVILGPSGCGKSTLLKAIAGVEQVDKGTICLDSTDITRMRPGDRDIAMVFQDYALYPNMSVRENLAFSLRSHRVPKQEIAARVASTSATLQIGDLLDRKPGALSGGQRQRVALGRAMIREPRAYLMDEPLSNLDAALRVELRAELIEFHRRTGGTVIYVTHDQVEAMTMGQRIAVMRAGEFEQIGVPADVYDRPCSTFVAGFLGSPKMNFVPLELLAGVPDMPAISTGALAAFRPEAVRLSTPAGPVLDGGLSLGLVPLFTEHLGNEVIVHSEMASASQVSVLGRMEPRMATELACDGSAVTARVDVTDLHVFDGAGTAIWHGRDSLSVLK